MDIGFVFEAAIRVLIYFFNFSFTIWGLTFYVYQVFIFVALAGLFIWFLSRLI